MPAPTVFPIDPADETFAEVYAYRTDVQASDDDTEQRIQLRQFPVGSFELPILARDREAQLANALLYRSHPDQWAVPWWPHGRALVDALTGGETEIHLDTDDLPFTHTGDPWVLWRSPFEFELVTAAGTPAGGVLEIAAPVAGAWDTAGTLILPARLARMAPSSTVDHESGALISARMVFALEPLVSGYPFEISAPTVDLLEIEPGRPGPLADRIERRFITLESGMGGVATATRSPAPAYSRDLVWQCFDRGEVAALRAWLDQRRGRAVPFLLPSWQRDLTLAAPAGAGATALDIVEVGYASRLFPGTNNRRRILFRSPAGTAYQATVTGAIDNGDGTETLTLAEGLGGTVETSWDVNFVRLCRLDTDAPRIEWSGSAYAEARLPVRELANEDLP